MSILDFRRLLPELDKTTEWFLEEIVYCLERYASMNKEEAYKALVTSRLMELLTKDNPTWMWREPAFHWAMCIVYGFDSYWWHDTNLWALHNQYVKERHHPPMKS